VPDERIAHQGSHRDAVVMMRYCARTSPAAWRDLRSAT
jgi:hypothetical protein